LKRICTSSWAVTKNQRQPCHLVAIKQKYRQTHYNVTQSLIAWLFVYAFAAGWHNRLL